MNHSLKVLVHKMVAKKEEVTHDEDYQRAEANFLLHFHSALQLMQSLEAYINALVKMGSLTKEFGESLSAYYQKSDSSLPRGVEEFNTAANSVDRTTRSLVTKELRDQVLQEWAEYCGFLQTLFNKIAERKQLLQDFDYYKKKVRDLKEKPSRDETSLPRNESKLYNAETAYDTLNQELIDVFRSVSADAHNAFNACLQKVLASTATVHSENGRVTAGLHEVVANPANYGCEVKDPKYKPLKLHYGISPVDPAKLKRTVPPRDAVSGGFADRPSQSSGASSQTKASVDAVPISQDSGVGGAAARKRVRGLFDFEATNGDELGFRVGDVLTVVEEAEESWWLVEKDGKRGMIPVNYVEVL